MKIKVYVVYGKNNLLSVISAGVHPTKESAEVAAKKYYDKYKIEEQVIEPVEFVEEGKWKL